MKYDPKVVSFERSPAYVRHRAMVNRRENNPVDALELMRQAAQREPENQEYWLDLAEFYCEMGCYDQSCRILLEMLEGEDPPAECYYGLALNCLGMNDAEGARNMLRQYWRKDPEGARASEARRLLAELGIFDALNRPASRRLYRAMRVANRAGEALKQGDYLSAKRLFEHSLALESEQFEMRALYATVLMLLKEDSAALREASRAAEGFPPSVRAMCVAAQVFYALGENERARALLRGVMEEHPHGVDLRVLLNALSEMEMHEEIDECARIGLQETPYDRQLLHIRAVALYHAGAPADQVARFWTRILRIDPEDTIAGFYESVCANGTLSENAPDYVYQVPEMEFARRTVRLSEALQGEIDDLRAMWKERAFRGLVRWALETEDERLRKMAVMIAAMMNDAESRGMLRKLLFDGGLPQDLSEQILELMDWRGATPGEAFSSEDDGDEPVLSDADALLSPLMVGERQLLRYAGEVLELEYDISALPSLTMMWMLYRRNRGIRRDPLTSSETISAALVYNYLTRQGRKPRMEDVAKRFGCSLRRMIRYSDRIAKVLSRVQEEFKNEDLRF